MYKLKQIPEDFIVKEISDLNFKDSGEYGYYKLIKKEKNTLDIVRDIAKKYGLKEKDIGFAGSKDRNAITEQVISIKGFKKKGLEFLGYGDKPITLGDLQGNEFEIVVRNLEDSNVDKNHKVDFVVNYFDEQRFSKNNVEIGESLIRKDFEKATNLIDDYRCQKHLQEKPNDFIGGLQRVSLRLLRLFVHSYQSYLWNEMVKKYLEEKFEINKKVEYSLGEFVFVSKRNNEEFPLIGFEESDNKYVKWIMEKEKLKFSDFIIKQLPELSLEGDMRKVFVSINNFKIGSLEEDNLNKGKKKIKVKFSLRKGSYATIVIKSMFN